MQAKTIKESKKKINKAKKSWYVIIGSLLFAFGISLISLDFINPYLKEKEEEHLLKDFYIQEEKLEDKKDKITSEEVKEEVDQKIDYNYIAVLKIPKIKLEKGFFPKDSKYNNVNYGIEILKESDSPDVINGNVILAAHSGTANISYFKNLDKISIGDEASIIYNGKTYNYRFVKIYDVEKTGKANIKRDNNTSTLTLITCRHNTNKQIVLIAEMQNLQ